MINPANYKGREQTYVKHFFLDRYLERVAHVTLARPNTWDEFVYIDAYSGPWRAQGESSEDTSVHIALTKLAAVRSNLARIGRRVRTKALFVERDPRAFSELRHLLSQFPDDAAHSIHGDFKDYGQQAARFVGGSAFSLTFIDPTGWNVDLQAMRPVLRLRGEVLINFMYDYVNRILTNPDAKIQHQLDSFFGGVGWLEEINSKLAMGSDREMAIVSVYAARLKDIGGFQHVTHTRIMKPQADRTYFYLIYATRHWRGLEEFRDVEEQALEAQEHVRFDARLDAKEAKSGMDDLLRSVSDPPGLRALRQRKTQMEALAPDVFRNLLAATPQFRAVEALSGMMELPLVSRKVAVQLLMQAVGANIADLELGPRERTPKETTVVRSRIFQSNR